MGRASDTKLPAMIQAQQLRSRLVQDGLLAVCGCLVLLIVLEASQLATNADLWHHTGFDYKLYMEKATDAQKIKLYRRFFPKASEYETVTFMKSHFAETMAEFQGLLLSLEQEQLGESEVEETMALT